MFGNATLVQMSSLHCSPVLVSHTISLSVCLSAGIETCRRIISVFMSGLVLLITISSSMSITVSTSSLMCYVCGCPGGGDEEGAEGDGHDKLVTYSHCSGQCDGELCNKICLITPFCQAQCKLTHLTPLSPIESCQ